jgi:hypothetical protein
VKEKGYRKKVDSLPSCILDSVMILCLHHTRDLHGGGNKEVLGLRELFMFTDILLSALLLDLSS